MIHGFDPQISRRGFTLIEVLITIGLLGLIAGLGVFVSMDSYRGNLFRAERNIVVSILQKARSQAIHNVCVGSVCADGQLHGVHFDPNQYAIFQGAIYNPADINNEVIQANSNVHNSGLANIVFSQLEGTTSGGTLTLTDNSGHTSAITINNEGQIIWTN